MNFRFSVDLELAFLQSFSFGIIFRFEPKLSNSPFMTAKDLSHKAEILVNEYITILFCFKTGWINTSNSHFWKNTVKFLHSFNI